MKKTNNELTKNNLNIKDNRDSKKIKKDKNYNTEKKVNKNAKKADDKKKSFFWNLKSNSKKNNAVKKYKKNKSKKEKQKRLVNGKFSLDIFDLLIVVVLTAIVSCVFTGVILNLQYKKRVDLINADIVADENVKNFLNTYSEIIDNYYEEVDENAMIEAALDGMLDFLKDNYSIYMNKEETDSLSEMLDGSYEGIGLLANGNIVLEVYEGSSAYEAGIKVNDEIIKINGVDISLDNYTEISNLIVHGEDNEVIVKREGKELSFVLETGKVNVPNTKVDVITSKNKDKKIGYIYLESFSISAFDEFHDKLKNLEDEEKIDSLIIDLRGNTGGYLNVASNISSLFLEKGKVIYSLEAKDKVTEYKDEDKEERKYKIVVLVNGSTASAAEILTAALHDSYGATVVGSKTFGKGKVQTMKYYEDTMVKYTSAKWLRPNGECVDEIGIEPDYSVEVIYDGKIIYDKQLDKAIELLS